MTHPEAIFFDLDGTLVEAGAAWRTAVRETVQLACTMAPDTHPGVLEAAYYDAARAAWDSVRIPAAPAWGSMEAEPVVAAVWTAALRCCATAGSTLVGRVVAAYYANLESHGATAYSDAADCLDRLRHSYRLGIITNGHTAVQRAKLARSGLAHYFGTVTTPDVGAGKPQRRIFECAAEAIGVRLGASVYVGDLLEWDIGGANGAGMASVWLNRKALARNAADPVQTATIASLTELEAEIARMAAQRQPGP